MKIKNIVNSFNKRTLAVLALIVFSLSVSAFLVGDISDSALPQALPEVSVDMSGNLNANFAIELPPGTKNVDPRLSIGYNSSGNLHFGYLGVGWNLQGIPFIYRDPAFPISYTTNDHFSSSISGDLVLRGDGTYTSNPETLVKYSYNPSQDAWSAKDKEGNTYLFQSRIIAPNQSNRAKAWYLSSFSDLNGNSYTIQYVSQSGSASKYPALIQYADRNIIFHWKNATKPVSRYTFHTEERDSLVLDSIQIQVASRDFRVYRFDYSLDIYGNERLHKIRRTDYQMGKTGVFRDILASYREFSKTIQFTNTRTAPIAHTYAMSRVPLPDKRSCIEGQLDCQTASSTSCPATLGAGLPACLQRKTAYEEKCADYKQKWEFMCFNGMRTPNSTMQPIDLDGDGKLELVRLIGDEQLQNIRLASISMNGELGEAEISGILPNIQYKTFYSMSFGDVDGDGRTDFAYSNGSKLVVAFSNGNSFSEPVTMGNVSVPMSVDNYLIDFPDTKWKGSLVDINGDGRADYVRFRDDQTVGIFLSNGRSFSNEIIAQSGNIYEGDQLAQFMDMDGDGRPEIVHIVPNGIRVRKWSSDFSSYSEHTIGNASAEDEMNRFTVDLNKDGKLDLVTIENPENVPTLKIYISSGNGGFLPPVSRALSGLVFATRAHLESNAPYPAKVFTDMNGDGYPDLLAFDGSQIWVYEFNPSTIDFQLVTQRPSQSLWTAFDLNGDGRAEIVSLKAEDETLLRNNPLAKDGQWISMAYPGFAPALGWLMWLAQLQIPEASQLTIHDTAYSPDGNLLTGLSDSYRKSIAVEYKDTSELPGAYLVGTASYPNLPNVYGDTVVQSIQFSHGDGTMDTDRYEYQNSRFLSGLPEARANLGFEKIKVTQSPENTVSERTYIQTSKELAGLVSLSRSWNSANQLSESISQSYIVLSPLGSPMVVPSVIQSYKYLNGSLSGSITQSFLYDSYGNQTEIVSSNVAVTGSTSETRQTNTFRNNTGFSDWRIGILDRSTKTVDGGLVEDNQYSYDSRFNVTSIVQFPGKPESKVTNYVYDSFGNPISVTDSLGRTSSLEYDSVVHNFIVKSTNPKGHVTLKSLDTATSLELSLTDPNGNVTTKTYDGFGRLEKTIHPGSLVESYLYQFNDTGHLVKKFMSDDVNGTIQSSEYFDFQGRSVRKESPIMGGYVQVELTEYDSLGRVARKSQPFIKDKETPVYTIHTYNADNQVVRVDSPDGSYTTISDNGSMSESSRYSSSGELLQSMVIRENAREEIISRTIQGRTISYKYNARGDLVEIRDPENGVTTMVYDLQGNKKSHTDGNTGTTNFVYDSEGNLLSKTDARGLTIQYEYDELNRLVKLSYPASGVVAGGVVKYILKKA